MGLDLTGYYAELRIDLKDSGAVWSDAELKRSIERAVQDLSRHIPLERIYETTLSFTVTDESATMPAAADDDGVVDAQTLQSKTAGQTLTLVNPDVNVTTPRPVTFLLTDADDSMTGLTIILKGIGIDGEYIEESFYLVNGKSQTGEKYFKWFLECEINYVAGTAAAGDVIDIGTSLDYDVWLSLANKPIKPNTETVTNTAGTTTYVRDTDYRMDYANGRIKRINGGDMAAATEYYVDYTKSQIGIDVSGILPVLTRITHVEYPAYKVPQQFVAISIWDNFMYIGSQETGESQTYLSDKEHVVIYYERAHTPPSLHSGGSYPAYLDQVVTIGAGAYALFIEAQQYEQQAVTDLASVRTELGLTTAVHALADAALDKVATYVGDADTALDKVIVYLETNEVGDSGVDNAVQILGNITDDVADMRTAMKTAVDAANTYLDSIATTDLDAATVGAVAWLLEGELLINKVNIGDRVPENFREYASTKIAIAQARAGAAMGYINEAAQRLDNVRTHIQESGAWLSIGQTFIAEAAQRLGMAAGFMGEANGRIAEMDRYLAEASLYNDTAASDLVLADRFREEARIRMREFQDILTNRAEYRKRIASIPTKQPASAGTTRMRTDRIGG